MTIPVTEAITDPESQTLREPQEEKLFNDAFFEEEARRVKASFPHSGDPNQLRHLRNVLREMKFLMIRLELPWDKFIPILYRGLLLQYERVDTRGKRAEFYQLTTDLISCITFLSQNRYLFLYMADFYHQQIAELDKKLAEIGVD